MSLADLRSTRSARETSQRFFKALISQQVREARRPWYARRVEAYLRMTPERPPERHGREDVERYLETLGGSGGLEDWQYVQAVEALRIFFSAAIRADWAGEVDWAYWKDSARRLGAEHATVAREVPIPALTVPRRGRSKGYLGEVRSKHPEVITRLIAEIRRRAYSIRTEQA